MASKTGGNLPPPLPGEDVPGTTLLCFSVAAVRSNLVVVTARVKGYDDPMTVLIDSGASYNFATKASVSKNWALYTKAVEDSKSNSKVSVRLATGSIVSNRKVLIPLVIKFDEFDSEEPFIVLDMDDRYDLIFGLWSMSHGSTVLVAPWVLDTNPLWDELWRVMSPPCLAMDLCTNITSHVRSASLPVRQEAMGEQGCRGSTDTLEGVEAGAASAREVETVGGGASGSAVVTIAQEDVTVGGCASRGAVVTPSQDVAVVDRSEAAWMGLRWNRFQARRVVRD